MANIYDRILKENIDPLLMPLLRKMLDFNPPKLVPLDAKLQVTQEGELDDLKKVVHDDPALDYGLHIEFHVANEDLRPRNMLHYALFFNAFRIPLRQIVVYLGSEEPTRISQNLLDILGHRSQFEVISLKKVPKEQFLNSNIPEELVLAILCDFGKDQPVEVVRMILRNLRKILKHSERLKKYQKQLLILSRLRKLQSITKIEINAMAIHYEIETDDLYLEGLEKGIEKGIEKGREKGREEGIEQKERDVITRMWDLGERSVGRIALIVGVSETEVYEVLVAHFWEAGLRDTGSISTALGIPQTEVRSLVQSLKLK